MIISHGRRKRARNGFTLVELMVATTVSGLVLAGVLATTLQIARGGARFGDYSEMDTQTRRALEQFGGDVRLATDLTWNGASDLTLSVPDANGTVSTVTYAWTSSSQMFFSVPGASSATTTGRIVLVSNLGGSGVVFERLNRSGVVVTTDAAAKFLRVSYTLTRSRIGGTTTTQRAAALFALRNKAAT
jgi:prepilin-type N-terminal cleavage/methylation domain-containing protein